MVTNLPEAAKSQWKRVVEAKTPEQKLEELKKFLSMVPKHKGTKNLIKQCKRQMARLREEIEERKKKKTGVYISNWLKSKHGEGRIAIIGFSHEAIEKAFRYLSHKDVQYPYWLYEPFYSIYEVDNIQFQLVSTPPLGIKDSLDYKIYNYLKTCDFVIGALAPHESPEQFIENLESKGISISAKNISVKIIKTPTGGIRVVGMYKGSYKALETLLREYRIYNAIVKIDDEAELEDIENAILDIKINIPGVLISSSPSNFVYYTIHDGAISAPQPLNKNKLLEEVLKALNLMRIYTSPNGKQVSEKPILLKRKSTVYDLAGALHRELQEKFKYAYVIRGKNKIKVSKKFTLEDGDIVHIQA